MNRVLYVAVRGGVFRYTLPDLSLYQSTGVASQVGLIIPSPVVNCEWVVVGLWYPIDGCSSCSLR